jgi:hypothetical protein
MMSITVRFTGICTHVTREGQEGSSVVLVHALDPTGVEGVWRLGGVRLNIEGAVGPSFHRDSSFEDVPKMKTEEFAAAQDVSYEVTVNEQAACYFDIEHGRMSSDETEHGAIRATLHVETTETPALRVTCFWNRESVLIHLRPGATIDVMHVGKFHGEESDNDYLLHYRIFTTVPPDAWVPEHKKNRSNRSPGDISIGCSNSQYP